MKFSAKAFLLRTRPRLEPGRANYSFKPSPLRGIDCVPALRLHAFAATALAGLTQVLGRSGRYVGFIFSKGGIRYGIFMGSSAAKPDHEAT